MQVAKINIPTFLSFKGLKEKNNNDFSPTILYSPNEDSFCKCNVCVEKPKTIKTQGEFRDLARKRVIHCPYCGKPMIAVGALYDMKRNGVFSGPIKEFVRQVKPYEECLKPGNKEVFHTIEQYAEKAPNTHLSRVIRYMYKDSLQKLRKAQSPIFIEFVRTAQELPDEYKPEFRNFMKNQKYKLLETPHIEKFNGDDFQYKVKRMSETVNNERLKGLMITLSESLNHPAFDNPNLEVPDKIIKKIFPNKTNSSKIKNMIMAITDKKQKLQLDNNCLPLIVLSSNQNGTSTSLRKTFINEINEALKNPDFNCNSIGMTREKAKKIAKLDASNTLECQNFVKKDIQLYVINQIRLIGEKLDREDLKYLSKISKNMVIGNPVVIPFSNKAFQLDLVKQLSGLEKTDIYYKLTNIAKKLPDSTTNKNSFITKHHYSNSDTIGYYLLRPSIATIEHIKPTVHKGQNNMGNWALACEKDNNKRSDMSMELFLKRFEPQNPQLYFDDIIQAANAGEINPQDVLNSAEAFKTEGNVIIDTSRLKLKN